jgi:uncharacterized protein (DUF3084 family)
MNTAVFVEVITGTVAVIVAALSYLFTKNERARSGLA